MNVSDELFKSPIYTMRGMGGLHTPSEADPVTGLIFPSNGSSTVRFHFQTPPSIQPLTVIWKINPTQQSGFYTTFFWGFEDGTLILEAAYWGCHPYPQGNPAIHNWEIAINGQDDITDENSNSTVVTKGQWYTQAAVSTLSGSDELDVKFYWNLSVNANRLIQHTTNGVNYLNDLPSDPGLFFGDAPWSEGNELLSGTLRGLQIYDAALTLQQIQDRMDLTSNSAVVAADPGSLWYCNLNPTPSDISDKSGNGNNPVWANANRPTLYQG